jgi:hypothetical protein
LDETGALGRKCHAFQDQGISNNRYIPKKTSRTKAPVFDSKSKKHFTSRFPSFVQGYIYENSSTKYIFIKILIQTVNIKFSLHPKMSYKKYTFCQKINFIVPIEYNFVVRCRDLS